MGCTNPCVFCCISRNFAFGGKSVTLVMDHGTMSRLMFGPIQATQPPHKMRERMRQRCVLFVVRNTPPSQFVVIASSNIVQNALTHKLVVIRCLLDTYHALILNLADSPHAIVLCREGMRSTLVYLGVVHAVQGFVCRQILEP